MAEHIIYLVIISLNSLVVDDHRETMLVFETGLHSVLNDVVDNEHWYDASILFHGDIDLNLALISWVVLPL